MVLSYTTAVKICTAYQFLICEYDEMQSVVTDICIIPVNLEQMAVFLEHYQLNTAEDSLQLSGFDKRSVRIVVIHEQTLVCPSSMTDLDEYLTEKNIPKTYEKPAKKHVVKR